MQIKMHTVRREDMQGKPRFRVHLKSVPDKGEEDCENVFSHVDASGITVSNTCITLWHGNIPHLASTVDTILKRAHLTYLELKLTRAIQGDQLISL